MKGGFTVFFSLSSAQLNWKIRFKEVLDAGFNNCHLCSVSASFVWEPSAWRFFRVLTVLGLRAVDACSKLWFSYSCATDACWSGGGTLRSSVRLWCSALGLKLWSHFSYMVFESWICGLEFFSFLSSCVHLLDHVPISVLVSLCCNFCCMCTVNQEYSLCWELYVFLFFSTEGFVVTTMHYCHLVAFYNSWSSRIITWSHELCFESWC